MGLLHALDATMVRVPAVAALVFAVFVLRADFATWGLVRLAGEIGGGKVLSHDTAVDLIDRPPAWAAPTICRRDVVLAGGRVSAAVVDSIVAAGDVPRVAPAIAALRIAAERVLDCSPGESLAWAWLAMARNQDPGGDDEVFRLFERAQRSAPSDLGAIAIRLPEIARALSRRGDRFAPLARADIRTLLADDNAATDAVRIVWPIFAWVGEIARQEFARIEGSIRRGGLIQTFGVFGVNIAGCPRESFVDWMYRGQRGSCESGHHIPDFDWHKPRSP